VKFKLPSSSYTIGVDVGGNIQAAQRLNIVRDTTNVSSKMTGVHNAALAGMIPVPFWNGAYALAGNGTTGEITNTSYYNFTRDSDQSLPKGTLANARYYGVGGGGMGPSGYAIGGFGTAAPQATIEAFNTDRDTASCVAKGNLVTAVYKCASANADWNL